MTSKFVWTIGAVLLTLVNLGVLAANLSIVARADVAGMNYQDLEQDQDFQTAVDDIAQETAKRVIQDCHVMGGFNIFC